MTPEEVGAALGVSRETLARLDNFVAHLVRWNRSINLVGDLDRATVWRRHILDSGQLVALAPPTAATWCDLGAGAGLPGMVCAILAAAERPDLRFTLVDADQRKAAFLRDCALRLGLEVTILRSRIEDLALAPQDVISARALAPLDRLLEYAQPFCHDATVLLLHKGSRVEDELIAAQRRWRFCAERVPSRSDREGIILKLSEIRGTS